MTEGLFVLTTLFVAYVIYVIVNEKKALNGAKNSASTTAATQEAPPVVTVADEPKAAPAKAKPAVAKKAAVAKPVVVEEPAPAPAATTAPATVKGSGLKDPKTGEVATTYSNYRFTKRWIKEALVAEKLVDKVYKNDELNADVEAKIKAGLAKLEGMKKYNP